MTEGERWCFAYLQGQAEIVDADPWPSVSADVLFALVNLGVRVRQLTRNAATPYEMSLRRLTFATDDLLAMILVAGDECEDELVVRTWRDARAECRELTS
ncbi:hypothetical protein [Mycobacterium paraintracellulare]|uniref:hypothetical protein n=1 Tax=Mycobacterium paraintracellulare TaxID=1138383 RepID=UPI0019169260|nr:hypothetical protein [Mycobacterium paraintracellulare]